MQLSEFHELFVVVVAVAAALVVASVVRSFSVVIFRPRDARNGTLSRQYRWVKWGLVPLAPKSCVCMTLLKL